MDSFATLIILIFLAILVVGIAQKIHLSYPIALIVGGAVISFISDLTVIMFDPNLILVIVLPPILYSAAFGISFREFKKNWKDIFSLALGLVILTSIVIGVIFKWLFPQFPWALAFAFGAIVSPPDAVAAVSIMKRFAISPKLLAIIEGESLVNDASALVLYKLAIATLLSGTFSFTEGSIEFFKIALGGVVIGFVLGFILQHLSRKFLDPIVAVPFSLTIPYITYISADYLRVSGVLAVVINGLIGSNILAKHYSSLRRVLGFAFWDILVILMNCFVFILIGLQLRRFIDTMTLNQILLYSAYACLMTSALIVIRFLWVYSRISLTFFKALMNPKTAHSYPKAFQEATIIGWSGMRGIVSLTAALALPYTFPNGQPIEGRDEVIFMTFLVILITLLLPSSTLTYMIRFFKIEHHVNHREAHQARKRLAKVAEEKIQHIYEAKEITIKESHFLTGYFSLQRYLFEISTSQLRKMSNLEKARLKVFQAQRKELLTMWQRQELDDRLFRELEHELDVEESHITRAELK